MRKILLSAIAIVSIGFSSLADVCSSPTSTVSGTDNAATTATVTDFTCVGAFPIASATLDASIGANCIAWYWYDIVVDGITVATQQCNQTGFDLTPYMPFTTVSIVSFDNPADGFGDGVTMVATVNLTYFPPCSAPSNVVASNITSNSVDFNWDPVGNAVDFTVEWGTPGFTPGTGAEIGSDNPATNSSTATGLASATNYEFYLMTDCGAVDGVSVWAGPFSATTSFNPPAGVTCGAGFATMIFSDDMETGIGWTGTIGTAAGQWDYPTGAPGGNSTGTGPSGPASGTTYAEYEASGSTALASMVTPLIDLSSGSTAAELSFYMHAFGAEIGTLNVGIGNSPTGPFTTEFSWTGQYQTAATDPWEQIGVDLTAYLGQQIYIEFSYAAMGPGFIGDMAIDLVQVETCVTCPAPTNFNLTASDLVSGDFDWTEMGAATEWELEYGTPGFTPGTGFGTSMLTNNNPETVGGLTSNSFYEIYLQSVCAPGDTSALVGPISFNTYNQAAFMDNDNACPASGFVDISSWGTLLPLTDDAEIAIDPLPFDVLFQGMLMTNMTVGDNGGLVLGTATGNVGYGGNFTTLADGTMFPWGDDMYPGSVYAGFTGTSPNQVLIVQWDEYPNYFGNPGDPTVTFQIQIEEATGEIYYVYDDAEFGGTFVNDDFGGNADIGISGPNQDITVSTNDPTYLMNNSCVHFFYTDCPNPVNYTVIYTTNDEAGLSWNAGLYGETDWTVIYGVQGFDPAVSGTTINTAAPTVIIPGLDDITTYDVYIYADCNPGSLQSTGYMGDFTTLPNCSDPTTLAATTAVDSLMTTWLWTESSGVGTYPSTGFNLQYGMNGFGLYDGSETIVNADNNYSDTTEDATLLGGGVYEVYVQGVCGTDTSNWVGPVTFTMPISNDSTCNAIDLAVDGTIYTFDNTGATTQVNEGTIAPPTTGFQTSDGWGDSNIDFTTWFTFTAPGSGNMNLSGLEQGFDGQFAVYEATDCSDMNTYTLVGANDDDLGGTSGAPNFSICGLTPGNTYYLMHDSWSTVTTGVYSIQLDEIITEAGSTSGILDICTGDTADLFNGISGYDMGGVWTEEITTANFAGSIFPSAGLAFQVFNFQYTVVEGCAMDSIIQQVQIYGPSSAGTDGTITVCQNQPVDLLSGLGGNVDTGGQWYDPANNPTPSAIVASNIPGSFNYDYITSNGVCPEDTANVIVVVDPTCDYLNIQEIVFGNMEVYPNPTTGVVYISNSNATEVFNFEITDVQGKVVATENAAINGTETTEINFTNLEVGIYMVRVYNETAEKTFRVVKQ